MTEFTSITFIDGDHKGQIVNKKAFYLLCILSLTVILITPPVMAQSWDDEAAREFEELRLQQLQTVQKRSEIAPFTTDGCSGNQSETW